MKIVITNEEMSERGSGVHAVAQMLHDRGFNVGKGFRSRKVDGGIEFEQDDKLCLDKKEK